MVNWSDPAEIARDADAFNKLIFALFGLYCWEICVTFEFDWEIITRKRPFKWPLTFYFLTRFALFFALLGLLITITVTTEVNCQALYAFCQWAGNTTIAGASTCLMIRTIAIWRKIYVTIPLVILSLGQWGLLYHGIVTVHAIWSPEANTCVVTGAQAIFLNILYFYTMSIDLIVLILTVIGLVLINARSSMSKLLLADGVVYFAVAFAANMVPAVLNVLDLNPAMNIIAAVPAAAVSAIAACRAVVRLIKTRSQEVYVHSAGSGHSRTLRATFGKSAVATVGSIGAFNNNPVRTELDGGIDPRDEIELDNKAVGRFNASDADLERGGV